MILDLLKVGKGEDTAAHYVVTCDLEALGRISDAAVFMAERSTAFPEVRDGVELTRAVADVIARGKDELAAG
jgi:hypothetical protein